MFCSITVIILFGNGQTDAASVLTEALGYIQFLHHQIQVKTDRNP